MRRMNKFAAGLSPNLRGALWMVLAALFFSHMNAAIKFLGHDLHGFEVAFFRSVFGFLVLAPILLLHGPRRVFRTSRFGMHGLRTLTGGATMLTTFYAISILPLADSTCLSFSQPLFMLVLAVVLFQETVGWHRRIAALIGFAGVVIAARPGGEGISPAYVVAILGAFGQALAASCVKSLSTTEKPLTILAWFSAGMIVVTAGPAAAVFRPPRGTDWLWLATTGLLGSLAQYTMIRAYRVGEASVVAPFTFVQLVFAAALGFALFGDVPRPHTLIGALIIIASVVYIMRREAIVHRRVPTVPEPPN